MTEEIEAGQEIVAYHKDKWKPGVLIQMGRKWAFVKLSGHSNNSKVPCGAVRKTTAVKPAAEKKPEPPPQPASGEIRLVNEDGWAKIRRGDRVICFLPQAYHKETEAILKTLRDLQSPEPPAAKEDDWEDL